MITFADEPKPHFMDLLKKSFTDGLAKQLDAQLTGTATIEPEGFFRFCTHCTNPVPEDRLARGADTCCSECKKLDRIAQRRFQKLNYKAKLLASPWFRKLVKEAGRSAPGGLQQ